MDDGANDGIFIVSFFEPSSSSSMIATANDETFPSSSFISSELLRKSTPSVIAKITPSNRNSSSRMMHFRCFVFFLFGSSIVAVIADDVGIVVSGCCTSHVSCSSSSPSSHKVCFSIVSASSFGIIPSSAAIIKLLSSSILSS